MSIEDKIDGLTAAITALTAAINAAGKPAGTVPEQPASTKKQTAKKEEPASTSATTPQSSAAPVEQPASAPAQVGATPQPTAETAASEGVEFKDLAGVFTKLVQTDYAKAKAICEREGVAKISGLAPEHYARVYTEVKGLVGE